MALSMEEIVRQIDEVKSQIADKKKLCGKFKLELDEIREDVEKEAILLELAKDNKNRLSTHYTFKSKQLKKDIQLLSTEIKNLELSKKEYVEQKDILLDRKYKDNIIHNREFAPQLIVAKSQFKSQSSDPSYKKYVKRNNK